MNLEHAKKLLEMYGWEFVSEVHPRDLIMMGAQGQYVAAGRLPENETVLPAGTELIKHPDSKLWAKSLGGTIGLVCFL